jgi:PKD repeat protein
MTNELVIEATGGQIHHLSFSTVDPVSLEILPPKDWTLRKSRTKGAYVFDYAGGADDSKRLTTWSFQVSTKEGAKTTRGLLVSAMTKSQESLGWFELPLPGGPPVSGMLDRKVTSLKGAQNVQCFLARWKENNEVGESFNTITEDPDIDVVLGVPLYLPTGIVRIPFDLELEATYGNAVLDWKTYAVDDDGNLYLLNPQPNHTVSTVAGQTVCDVSPLLPCAYLTTVEAYQGGKCARPLEMQKRAEGAVAADEVDYAFVASAGAMVSDIDVCDSLKYTFHIVDGNQIPILNIVSWTVTQGTNVLHTAGTVSPLTYTFPTANQAYTVSCTYLVDVTDSGGNVTQQSETTSLTVTPTNVFTVDFENGDYWACPGSTPPFDVPFKNLSTGKSCPMTWTWDYGDSTSSAPTSTGIDGQHLYNAAGTYNVTLTASNNSGVLGSATKPVVVEEFEPEIVIKKKCGDGKVTLTTVDDYDKYEWDTPTASLTLWQLLTPWWKRQRTITVCFQDGNHTVRLKASKASGATCEDKVDFPMTVVANCCKRVYSTDKEYFEYPAGTGWHNYRLVCRARSLGVGWGRITAVAKLQKRTGPNGVWLRKRAHTIEVSWNGQVMQKDDGCFCNKPVPTSSSNSKSKRSRVQRTKSPGTLLKPQFRTQKWAVAFKFKVKIDANHSTPFEHNLSHAKSDCNCKGN